MFLIFLCKLPTNHRWWPVCSSGLSTYPVSSGIHSGGIGAGYEEGHANSGTRSPRPLLVKNASPPCHQPHAIKTQIVGFVFKPAVRHHSCQSSCFKCGIASCGNSWPTDVFCVCFLFVVTPTELDPRPQGKAQTIRTLRSRHREK